MIFFSPDELGTDHVHACSEAVILRKRAIDLLVMNPGDLRFPFRLMRGLRLHPVARVRAATYVGRPR